VQKRSLQGCHAVLPASLLLLLQMLGWTSGCASRSSWPFIALLLSTLLSDFLLLVLLLLLLQMSGLTSGCASRSSWPLRHL
jgi:hypothetical protein